MKRIQRKRTKGWKIPANTVYVGRPTKWGNPFRIVEYIVGTFNVWQAHEHSQVLVAWGLSKEMALELILQEYKKHLDRNIHYGILKVEELRGKNLACFCPLSYPCHADILIKAATQRNCGNLKSKQ